MADKPGEYLPPLVTKLKADISDLKKGFEDAKRIQKDYANDLGKLDDSFKKTKTSARATGREVSDFERLVTSKMRSGGTAVSTMRDEWKRLHERIKEVRREMNKPGGATVERHGELKSLLADTAKLGSLGADIGIKLGDGLGKSIANSLTATGPIIQTALVAALVAGAALAAPLVAGALAAAITVGLGAGVIGLGAYILANDKDIKTAAEKMTEITSGVFKRAAQPLKGPFLAAIKSVGKAFKDMEPDLKAMFAAAAPLVKPATDGILGLIKNMLPGITEALKNSEPVFKTLGDKLPLIGTAIGEFFKTITVNPDELSFVLEEIISLTAGAIVVLGEIIAWLVKAYKKMDDWGWKIRDAFDSVKRTITEWWDKAKIWIAEIFTNLGKMIMASITGGVIKERHKLNGAMGDAMGAAVEAAKNAIDSHSPSRVYMEIGASTMDGYVIGIQSRAGAARAALRDVLTAGGASFGAASRDAARASMSGARNASLSIGAAPVVLQLDGRTVYETSIKYAQRGGMRNVTTGMTRAGATA